MDAWRNKKTSTPNKLSRRKIWRREKTEMFAKNLNKTTLGNARYLIIQSFKFDASHSLNIEDFSYLPLHALADLSKCFYNHGHTYCLDVEWEGFPTDAEPMICPFGYLKSLTQTLINNCDHQNLNNCFPWPTTLENVGNWFFKRLQSLESDKVKLASIILQEGSNNRVKVMAV